MLKMLDKIDDIIYEPVKLICDAFRQPLKNMDAANERKKMALANEIDMAQKQLEHDLYKDKLKADAEIEAWIADKNFERHERFVQAIKKYQEELGAISVQLNQSIAEMTVEVQDKARTLVMEKTKLYLDMTATYKERIRNIYYEIRPQLSDRERDIFLDDLNRETVMLTEVGHEFIKGMNNDLAELSQTMKSLAQNAQDKINMFLDPAKSVGVLTGTTMHKLGQ